MCNPQNLQYRTALIAITLVVMTHKALLLPTDPYQVLGPTSSRLANPGKSLSIARFSIHQL